VRKAALELKNVGQGLTIIQDYLPGIAGGQHERREFVEKSLELQFDLIEEHCTLREVMNLKQPDPAGGR
jgi:hypothetical protein